MNYKEFFYFQKSDRSVLIVLLFVTIIVSVLIYGVGGRNEATPLERADTTVNLWEDGNVQEQRAMLYPKEEGHYAVEGQRVERFVFDPNTADSTQLLRLGLQPWQVRNIYRYRAKGGIYREPKDFARLYGLTVKQFRELEPYIHISDAYRPASTLFEHEKPLAHRRDTGVTSFPTKLKEGETMALNLADTSMLKRVPGIGSYYAREIVRYGQRLGGYVDVSQLREIEDLPEEVCRFFLVKDAVVRKLNVNKLTLGQLKSHPYLNFYQARSILDYRRLRGPLRSMDDLAAMREFSPRDIERLRPYLEF